MRLDRLDLRPFQGASAPADEEAPAPAPSDEGLLVAVPDDSALTVDAEIGEVVTKQVKLEDVKGTMIVAESAVRMNDLQVSMLGGSARVSGIPTSRRRRSRRTSTSTSAR